jgi:glycine/D-amino acid oxidase-like deaminating enzyme
MTMFYDKPIRRIAIVGTGVIGASWAAEFLARGFDVVVTDPAPKAEANLPEYIDRAWKNLTSIGLSAHPELAVALERRRGWNPTFHGSSHASAGRNDEGAWNSKYYA